MKYIRIYFFSAEIPSISAKKTIQFIYFTKENKLLLTPAIYYKEFIKKNFLGDYGSFTATFKIPYNVFPYDKKVPFEIDIDCTNLKTDLFRILICLHRFVKKIIKMTI